MLPVCARAEQGAPDRFVLWFMVRFLHQNTLGELALRGQALQPSWLAIARFSPI